MDTQNILIVEDDALTRKHLGDLASSVEGVEVISASTPTEALDALASKAIALAILDVDLGSGPTNKYAGLTLLSKFSERCPVIVVSGIQEENLGGVSLSLRAYDFIAKPINDLDFLNKVRHALQFKAGMSTEQYPVHQTSFPAGLTPDPQGVPGLLWHNKPVRLTLTHLRLVYALIAAPGAVVEASRLTKAMATGGPDSLATHMMNVRQKFRDVDPSFHQIRTEAGKGYAWEANS